MILNCCLLLTQPGKQPIKLFQNRLENRSLNSFLPILCCSFTKDCTIVSITFLKAVDFCYMTAVFISDFLLYECLFSGN